MRRDQVRLATWRRVDHYQIWVDLRPGVKDMDFYAAIKAMHDHLQAEGAIESWSILRRKLGFGPEALGEWHIDIVTRDMRQLQDCYDAMTPRTGKMEKLHAAVWSKVTNFKAGLSRDFPDANRQ